MNTTKINAENHKYRARPHRDLPPRPAQAGGGGRGEVVIGRDGGRERYSPDCLSCLSAHIKPLLALALSLSDTLTQVIMSGLNTFSLFICIFQSVEISPSHSHVLHRRVKYNLRTEIMRIVWRKPQRTYTELRQDKRVRQLNCQKIIKN